jgi:Flp pilus assembly pilin Flp
MTYMLQLASRFLREKEGQDLVEYTLLMGFVALAAAALFPTVAANIRTIWNVVSNHLSNAAVAATT